MLSIKNKNLEYILLILILAFLYASTGIMSLNLLSENQIVSIGVFVPEGIALAFALFFGKKVIAGIFIGQFILAYFNAMGFITSFEIAFINSLEALIAIMLFKRLRLNVDLKRLKDMVGLILMSIVVLQVFSAFFSNMVLLMNGKIVSSQFLESAFSWWFGNIMGQLLFTPFLLLLFVNYKEIDFKKYLIYGIGFAIYVYILEFVVMVNNIFLLLSSVITIAIYITLKKGVIYGTFMNVIMATIVSYSIYIGVGSFQLASVFDNTINYNFFVLVHTSIIIVIGTLFDEKKIYEKNLRRQIDIEVNKNKEQQLLMMQQSRLAQMGEMISMIGHQWRQPLNNLSLVNQLLISKYNKGKLDDKSIEYFKINSKKQIDLMSTTIDDFRNFFQTEKKKIEFNIVDVIENVFAMTKPIYEKNHIKINFHKSESIKYKVLGFSNSLAQAILNIINNAKDALVENNEAINRKIEIILDESDGDFIIIIKDNAGGIPQDIIQKVFDPYFSTKQEKNGTGLGLYMSKLIIEDQMCGRIKVSNASEGAMFEIYLKGRECVC